MPAKKETAASPKANKTNALLAWIFAPITSFIFMNDEDEFTKKCAKHSLYFGVVMVVVHVALWILGTVGAVFIVGTVCFCVDAVVWIADIAVRVMGAVKANNGELFEVPVISGMVKE
ncbi:DUF4870 domain-containing protein [Candidatus Dojkabacteria bacterium]|nr:DUF4870 domain-containing protein [Candidatus Dojkabacteria bacterium]